MYDPFVPDEAFISKDTDYYRTLSDLVHEYRQLVVTMGPPELVATLDAHSCPCVACAWAVGEAEGILNDGA